MSKNCISSCYLPFGVTGVYFYLFFMLLLKNSYMVGICVCLSTVDIFG